MRNPILDIVKALGIMLVIVGHNSSGILENYILSFHMPLFFILAGYLWKEREIGQSLRRDFKRLLLPYLLYFIFLTVLDCIISGISLAKVTQSILMIVWGSAHRAEVLGHHIQGVGYLWFLPALYVCKNVFNAIYVGWKRIGEQEKYSYVCMYGPRNCYSLQPLSFAIWYNNGTECNWIF